ncbi:hypothetical protein C8Q78DRAFT_1000133 [Trametes maxima]|nr:hypothetical protein C8Q78DRAFT_1000133 [Trametes maxima]
MSSLTTNVLRRSLRRAPSCSRYASSQGASSPSQSSAAAASTSQTKLDVKPQAPLPDEKLRVLVNLYQQSGTFITKENLSSRIDEAFIDQPDRRFSQLSAESPFRTLEMDLVRRRALPKFGQGNEAIAHSRRREVRAGEAWSDQRSPRERAVMTTLYGVLGRGKPGFEALKDEEERIKRQLRADSS